MYLMRKVANKIIIIIIILIGYTYLFSAIPRTLHYQGKLLDSSSVGINDTIALTFRLYDSETVGPILWEETITNVIISKGLLSVELGTADGFDTLSFSNPYWLEIEVEGEILSPREKLNSVPYAIRSTFSDNISYSSMDSVHNYGGITLSYTCGEAIDVSDAVYLPGSLAGWTYRIPITIANLTANSQTNYQMNIGWGNELTSFWTNNSHPSGNDVRFTDTDGASLLNFWKNHFSDEDSADFWVRISNIPAMSTKMIYLYYSNDTASSASNFDNTFTKNFFESGLVGLWHMDEASGELIADESGNMNHGTLYNSPSWQTYDGGQ